MSKPVDRRRAAIGSDAVRARGQGDLVASRQLYGAASGPTREEREMRLMKSAMLGVVLLLPALATRGAVTAPACPVPQSPRDLDPRTAISGHYSHSYVVSVTPSQDEVRYRPRGPEAPPRGETGIETLYRCGQHYHVPVENV
jgi:hypothetical protein